MSASLWEIASVLLTGVGNFLVAGWLHLQLAYVVGACLLWAGFVAVRATADSSVLTEWGFTTRNFGQSLELLTPILLLVVSGFAVYGMLTGSIVIHWHMVLIGLLYPLWGLVQQFLIVALLAGNIRKHSRVPERTIVLFTALVFAGAHLPSLPLVGAAFFLGLVTTTIYFRTRNLWALGLFHGWYATALYFFVLGRNPWMEVVSARLWP